MEDLKQRKVKTIKLNPDKQAWFYNKDGMRVAAFRFYEAVSSGKFHHHYLTVGDSQSYQVTENRYLTDYGIQELSDIIERGKR